MTNSSNRYTDFRAEDFICDPFFQEWVIAPNEEKELFWKDFLANCPDKNEAVEKARAVLLNISFAEHLPSDDLVQRSLNRHLEAILNSEGGKVVRMKPFTSRFGKLLRVAAVFGGVALTLFLATQFFRSDKAEKLAVQTEYGKLKQVLLPDSSSIVLNAHSKIEYNKDWNKSKKREVWLEGEAFFDVRHLNQDTMNVKAHDHFIVHTEDLDVEVLGTSFNIRQRRGKTEVVLQTGRIKLSFKDNSHEDIIMKPGEVVTYNPEENDFSRTTAVPENYTAWKEKKLLLNNPTVDEIAAYLEDNFGKKIILQDDALGERKIEGPILLTNLDDALFILSTVLSTEVIRKDSSTIILRHR
ncbi:FecR domain-containing protein [Chitinophagaceae bacterium LB-8]|uniref:FecR domain-containing protein n=1 Tax=Paraflavisolibacter caeni TaxID=2982496 RepID=A0A9X2Y0G4_9BACT|nr:FecR domain-containing protein [Paraflavisolibacter caeni]MCU7552675.1 FecR domain-containing protein [Paraflavisolibacter caeni]